MVYQKVVKLVDDWVYSMVALMGQFSAGNWAGPKAHGSAVWTGGLWDELLAVEWVEPTDVGMVEKMVWKLDVETAAHLDILRAGWRANEKRRRR